MARTTRIDYVEITGKPAYTIRKWEEQLDGGERYPAILEDVNGVEWTTHTDSADVRVLIPWHRVTRIETKRTLTAEQRRLRVDEGLR